MNEPLRRYGKRVWAFAAGHIPLHSTGHEPEFTSHDKVAILNTSNKEAEILLRIVFGANRHPVDHNINVPAYRVKKVRFNDLIDPLPVPLNVPFGFVLLSSVEVVVQFSRLSSAPAPAALFCVTAFSQSH